MSKRGSSWPISGVAGITPRVLAIDPDHDQANQMYKDLVGSRELQRLLKRARSMR